MRSLTFLSLAASLLSTGCVTFMQEPDLFGPVIQQPQSRNYLTNPVTLGTPPPVLQPSWGTGIGADDQYHNVLVNTPNGMVYRRCKVINGKAVACF